MPRMPRRRRHELSCSRAAGSGATGRETCSERRRRSARGLPGGRLEEMQANAGHRIAPGFRRTGRRKDRAPKGPGVPVRPTFQTLSEWPLHGLARPRRQGRPRHILPGGGATDAGAAQVFPAGCAGAFPSEVDTGSREGNASNQRSRAFPRFHETGKCSSHTPMTRSRRPSARAPRAWAGPAP